MLNKNIFYELKISIFPYINKLAREVLYTASAVCSKELPEYSSAYFFLKSSNLFNWFDYQKCKKKRLNVKQNCIINLPYSSYKYEQSSKWFFKQN